MVWGCSELGFQVAAQVAQAVDCDLGTAARLSEYERALEDGLGIKTQALGGPWGARGVQRLGLRQVVGNRRRVLANVLVTHGADRRVIGKTYQLVSLLIAINRLAVK